MSVGFVYGLNAGGAAAKIFGAMTTAMCQLGISDFFRPLAAHYMTKILYGFDPHTQLSTQNSIGIRAFKTRVGTALLIDVCNLLLSPIVAFFIVDEGTTRLKLFQCCFAPLNNAHTHCLQTVQMTAYCLMFVACLRYYLTMNDALGYEMASWVMISNWNINA